MNKSVLVNFRITPETRQMLSDMAWKKRKSMTALFEELIEKEQNQMMNTLRAGDELAGAVVSDVERTAA